MTEWITFISQYGDTLTLAGLIIGLFAWLRQDMNKQEERLMGHINKQDERLMGHINKQDERLMGHINKLDEKQTARTDQLRQELTAHMNKLDEKQTARVDEHIKMQDNVISIIREDMSK